MNKCIISIKTLKCILHRFCAIFTAYKKNICHYCKENYAIKFLYTPKRGEKNLKDNVLHKQ